MFSMFRNRTHLCSLALPGPFFGGNPETGILTYVVLAAMAAYQIQGNLKFKAQD